MRKLRLITVAMAVSLLCSNCLGSFSAFNGLKDWNQQVSDSKFVNNLLFWGLNIIPVYGVFFIGDTILFNVIEFWSGSNPIAMNEGEVESQTIQKDGNTYEMIATKNQMDIKVLDGEKAGEEVTLIYKPEEKSWNAKTDEGEMIKLSSMKDGFYYVYTADGEPVKMDKSTSREEGMAIIKGQTQDCNTFYATAK